MNEDEAINEATKFVQKYREKEQKFYDYLFSMKENDIPIQAIETLLDLYQQEKGKNKELEEKQNRLAFKTNQYMNDVLSNNIVSKDKIRAKIEEIMNYTYSSEEERDKQKYAYDRLKELLEEENTEGNHIPRID